MEMIHTRAHLSSHLVEEAWFSIPTILSVWCDIREAWQSKGHLTCFSTRELMVTEVPQKVYIDTHIHAKMLLFLQCSPLAQHTSCREVTRAVHEP